jgi:signal transduction histidine kinase
MKLRPRIALVSCLVALTSVGLTGALLIRQSRAYATEELLQRQLLLAQARAFAVGDELETASRELVRLSQMAEVDLTDNDLRPEASLLAHAHRNSTIFNIGLQILDSSGRCLWSEPASEACPGHSYAEEPWFIEGRRAHGPLVLREQAVGADSVINLVVPIGGSPGAADGVLRGVIDLRTDKIISPGIAQGLPAGTRSALVARSGAVIFPAGLRRTAGWKRAIGEAADGPGAFVSSEEGGRFLYAYAPVAHAAWGLIFRWPYEVLDVGLERQLRLLLEILALGGLLAVLLGLSSSRFLTRPLEELLRAVRSLGAARASGGTVPPLTPESAGRDDELGELARAFAELQARLAQGDELHRSDLERIRDLASSLEQRVQARTAELEAAQRSLVAQERLAAMGRAAAVISHELKNSLGALGMGIDLVALEGDRLPHLKRVNAQVRAEVNRLRAMTDDLLVFARTPRIDLSPVDLDELVHRTVELCREQALASDVHVQTRSGRGSRPLIVACDAARIQSVLVNLLQNAIEAVAWSTAPGAPREVLVSTQEAAPGGPAFASLAVEDSGPGVSAVAREHLFEPFFTTKRNGTGLGLATAQRFTAAHGGHIELQASSLGGARFVVRLPVRDARHAEVAA